MLVQEEDQLLQDITSWLESNAPWLLNFLEDVQSGFGLFIIFLIPFAGAGVAVVLFLLLALSKDPDPNMVLIIFIAGTFALIVIVLLIIITFGLAALLWGYNAVGLTLLLIACSSILWGTAGGATTAVVCFFTLTIAVVKRRKLRSKIPRMCLTIGGKEVCVGAEKTQ